jgi:hypothetical protein
MKRRFLPLLALAFLATPLFAFQSGGDPNWFEIFTTFALNLVSFAAAVVAIAEWLVGRILQWDGAKAWIGSLLVAEVLGFVGYWLKLGMFGDLTLWWHVALVGFGGTLVANGIFSIEIVRSLLEAVGIRLPAAKR